MERAVIRAKNYQRGKGVGLDPLSVRLLGAVAANGLVPEFKVFPPSAGIEDRMVGRMKIDLLIQREILSIDADGNLALGKFGKGNCEWIWGKPGKPTVREIQPRKPAQRKKAEPKPAKPMPSDPRARSLEQRARIAKAINRTRRP